MSERCPMIGVLAAIDPDDQFSVVDAEVIRCQLEHRLGPAVFCLRTTLGSGRPLRHTSWASTPPSGWVSDVDVVVVDDRLDLAARERAGLVGAIVTVDTSLWSDEAVLASLFLATADPAAIDTRRRMLDHLGLSMDRVIDERLNIGALDLYLLASDGARDTSDPRVRAIVDGLTGADAGTIAEFDRLGAAIAGTISVGGHALGGPADLVQQLEAERRARSIDERRAVERLDNLEVLVGRLRTDIESAELRADLQPPIDAG